MSKQILGVDDDKDIAKLLHNIISASGHFVTTCHDGIEAISLILKEDFNVILLDLDMPGLSGYEVIDSLDKEDILKQNNIVVLTANNITESEIQKFKEKGVGDVFQKPMNLEGILEVIKKYE